MYTCTYTCTHKLTRWNQFINKDISLKMQVINRKNIISFLENYKLSGVGSRESITVLLCICFLFLILYNEMFQHWENKISQTLKATLDKFKEKAKLKEFPSWLRG